MNAKDIIARAISNEVRIARDGLTELSGQKDKLIAQRDVLQAQIEEFNAAIAKLQGDEGDAQKLISDLQSEVTTVQARKG